MRLKAPSVVAAVAALAALAVTASASFGGGTYVVRAGDTLTAIAGRFGTTVGALAASNNLSDPNRIFAGQVLDIDDAASSTSGPVALTASAGPGGSPQFPAGILTSPTRSGLRASFRHWAAVSGVPAGLVESVCWMESGWQSDVVSATGAVGIGQIEPSTARFVSRTLLGLTVTLDPADPDANIRMTAAYLSWLLGQTGGDVATALGGYYQGLRSIQRRGMLLSTRLYIADIVALWGLFRSG